MKRRVILQVTYEVEEEGVTKLYEQFGVTYPSGTDAVNDCINAALLFLKKDGLTTFKIEEKSNVVIG